MEQATKVHLVSLEGLCVPKKHGGLGLYDMRRANQVSMLKNNWKLINNRTDKWVQLVRTKYKCGGDTIPYYRLIGEGVELVEGD